jgi:hypothetical protein
MKTEQARYVQKGASAVASRVGAGYEHKSRTFPDDLANELSTLLCPSRSADEWGAKCEKADLG